MSTRFNVFSILIAISLLISGCGALPAQIRQEERAVSKAPVYESILGKSLNDDVVTDFITGNSCSRVEQFLLCKTVGMALWTDSNQVVETVYLYLNNTNGFAAYVGELPFGLKFYDTLGGVEYKLNRQGVGNAGLPDVGATPDHRHYRAIYYQAGMTVIYNTPFADEDATIYAILVGRQNVRAKDQP